MHRIVVVLCLVAFGLGLTPSVYAQQQDVPPELRRELQRRGLTVQEARQRARQLGIDPSRPAEAAQRARELGVPESQIQLLLQVAQADRQPASPGLASQDTAEVPTLPALAGRPLVTPDSINVSDLPRRVEVSIPLQSQQTLREVQPLFLTAGGDTVRAATVSRVSGSNRNGTWRGFVEIPGGAEAGEWTLFADATTPDTTLTITTGRRLLLLPDGETFEERAKEEASLPYFGYKAFNTIPDAFRPRETGPVDDGYVVGPSDELRLTVWGGAEFTYDLTVDRAGRVTVPNVGQFTVSGKRLSQLRRDMKQWLSRSYAGLTSTPPTVFMDLMVTRVRPVQVYVLGEVAQPGGYVVSSYATVFNALYSVGGPLRSGSLRTIRVIRNGEVIQTVDMYDYLLQGYSTDPVQLQSNDYIFIPPRQETVAIRGAVKRPAFYELREDETFQDLLNFAGGLQSNAYTQRFQVSRVIPFEERTDPSIARSVTDYGLLSARSGETSVPLFDGDKVRILSIREASDPLLQTRVEAVEVTGAVLQPGRYALSDSLRTVRDLINRADGLAGDAFLDYAELIRVEDDLDLSSRELNLSQVMGDAPTENVVLRAGDSLHVSSVQQMRTDRFVEIEGRVRQPGSYRFRKGMTIRDLLMQGGGLQDDEYLKDTFLERADLYRVSPDGSEERIIPFHLGDALDGEGMGMRELRPEDRIRVYGARVERLENRFVFVSGSVKTPQRLPYRDNMTLRDAILQAGGFQEGASLRFVEVTRMIDASAEEGVRAVPIEVPLADEGDRGEASFSVRDTTSVLQAADAFRLQHRDQIFIRKDPNYFPQRTVTLSGEVRYPGRYTLLRENERLSSVVRRAGGVLRTGYLAGGRLRRDGNQIILEMDRALRGDRTDDIVLQGGDEIIIPVQPNTVAIRGNVANEGLVKHVSGRRVEYYLERAGGEREDTEAILLTQASGATFRIGTGWFRRTPKVDDGATIRVIQAPPKPESEKVDIGETITDVTGVLSSALTILVLATRAFD